MRERGASARLRADTAAPDPSGHHRPASVEDLDVARLEQRLGRRHARQRLGVEMDHEAQIFGYGRNFFHFENSRLFAFAVEYSLKMSGLYWRGRRNAGRVRVTRNVVRSAELPAAFDGYTVLQLSDLHCEMSAGALAGLPALLEGLDYDLCVITGDFRGPTWGPHESAVASVAALMPSLRAPVYGVLGNHDTIRMVPGLEEAGVRMLLNEAVAIERGGARIHLVGVDDPHFYRADNIEKAAADVPQHEFSILLAHTPEIYRQAAHADFNLLLSGHTHGGQICLPGGIPLIVDSDLPRRLAAGAWMHHRMHGYTSVGTGSSVVPVRFNCPPEITLHRLEAIG